MAKLYERAHHPSVLTRGHSAAILPRLGSAQHANDRDIEIFPGVMGTDPRWIACAHDLVETLTEELPPSEVVDGAYQGAGISGNWTKLLTVPFPQRPMGHPVVRSDVSQRATMLEWQKAHPTQARERWLREGFSADEIDLLRWLCRRYFKVGGFTPIHVRAQSSLGLPLGGNSVDARLAGLEMWHKHGEEIVSLLANHDLDTLYLKFNLLAAWISQWRLQNDKWIEIDEKEAMRLLASGFVAVLIGGQWYAPKIRSVFDPYSGKSVKADKGMFFGDYGMARKRTRPVAGVPAMLAAPLLVMSHMIAKSMYEDDIYKVRGADDLRQRLEVGAPTLPDGTCYRYRGDVSNSDANQPVEGLDIVIEELEAAYGAMGSLAGLLFKCPTLCCPDRRGVAAIWTGDPRNYADFNAAYVIPSGHPLTTVVTTIMNLWHTLCGLQRELGYGKPEFDAVLRGRGFDLRLFVGGDNLAISGRVELPPFEELITPVPTEATDRIMGYIPVVDSIGSVRYVNDIRGVTDKIPPEHAWNAKSRPFAAFGFFAQRTIYSSHPRAAQFYDVLDSVTSRHLGEPLSAIWQAEYKDPAEFIENADNLTAEEMYVLLKPEAIYYMNVDPRILERRKDYVPFVLDQPRLADTFVRLTRIEPFHWYKKQAPGSLLSTEGLELTATDSPAMEQK